jgi:ribonuclease P protein component
MLKKQHRLTSDFEFKVTRKYGKKYSYEMFNCIVCQPLNYTGPTKIGIIVPISYHKNATKRNRVRRLFREAIQTNLTLIPENFWLVFYPKTSCLYNDNYEAISTQINKALSEIPFLR